MVNVEIIGGAARVGFISKHNFRLLVSVARAYASLALLAHSDVAAFVSLVSFFRVAHSSLNSYSSSVTSPTNLKKVSILLRSCLITSYKCSKNDLRPYTFR